MAQDEQNCSKTSQLKTLRESVDWKNEDKRLEFLDQLFPLIENWNDGLPNLRDIFQQGEIELLLVDSLNYYDRDHWNKFKLVDRFIKFVVSTGYKDEPILGKDGNPLLHRNTPVHLAARRRIIFWLPKFFEIYNRFDVNFIDEGQYTHFHAACLGGCVDVVEKFLELGQDPNCPPREPISSSADSPLNLTVFCNEESGKKMVESLLKRGADPTLVNAMGPTPLHIIGRNVDRAKMLFEINNDIQKTKLLVNARNKFGQTPLHLATKNEHVDLIEFLLRKGADPNAVDRNGKTPLQLIHRSNVKVLELFRKIREEKDFILQKARRKRTSKIEIGLP